MSRSIATSATGPTRRSRALEAGAGEGSRQVHHRRQCEPAFGRRRSRRADGRQGGEKRGLQPLGVFKGWAVAGCEPDEMGSDPSSRSRACSSATVSRSTISTCGSSTRRLRASASIAATRSGSIREVQREWRLDRHRPSLRHDRSRLTGHVLMEGQRRKAKHSSSRWCIGGGMAARDCSRSTEKLAPPVNDGGSASIQRQQCA
jgi:hypothetical protein